MVILLQFMLYTIYITYFGTGCRFSTALKSNKHDDIVLAFCRSPGFHTGVDQLK